jgi:hypothetical protein
MLATATATARAEYAIQRLVQPGDRVETIAIQPGSHFEIGTLTDAGQLVFTADTAAGATLFQLVGGQLTPIMVAGGDAPGGKWATSAVAIFPVSMNRNGNVAFTAPITIGDTTTAGTFLWDAAKKQVQPVALKGMPAVGDQAFDEGGSPMAPPVLNNHDEIVFTAKVKGPDSASHSADFLRDKEGHFRGVALPGQWLPDGSKVVEACVSSLNDFGLIAFDAQRPGETGETYSVYLLDGTTVTPLALAGQALPGIEKLSTVYGQLLNNANRNALLVVPVGAFGTPAALYLATDKGTVPVAVPGREMPGGGRLVGVGLTPSYADDSGRHAFFANLEGGATGLYLMGADGTLSLVLKSGDATLLGRITHIGGGFGENGITGGLSVGLNNKGQIAVTVRIDNGPDTIVLLTPAP